MKRVKLPVTECQANVEIVVLSGMSGCGKTTICTKIVELARHRQLSVDGLLTLPRYLCDHKTGLDVQHIRTGEVRSLAETRGMADGPPVGRFRFYSDGVRWGNEILSHIPPCDLFLLDELGPLELSVGQGWHIGLEVLRRRAYGLAVVVVRPVLIERFEEMMTGREILKLDVTQDNRDMLAEWILSLCARQKENADGRVLSGGA